VLRSLASIKRHSLTVNHRQVHSNKTLQARTWVFQIATRVINRPRSTCGTPSEETVRVRAAATAATASSCSFAIRLSAALASSSGMLLLRRGLLRLDCVRLDGLDVGERGLRILLARVLGTLGPSRMLPGAVRKAVLMESWLWLSELRSRDGAREGFRERTNSGSSPLRMCRNSLVAGSTHQSL
jgi:hypothetical protein